jgi:carboxyl-terminal processing protease
MMRKLSLLLTGAALGVIASVAVSQTAGYIGQPAFAAVSDTYKALNLFGDIFDRVRSDYVEKPEDGKLVEAAINGMLTSLDPHSSYMDAKNFKDMQTTTSGKFGGLGIEVTQEDGVIKVVSPIEDTPASRAGILSNDLIVQIDGESVQGLTLQQAVEKMRGDVGKPVALKIKRTGADALKDFTLMREQITVRAVRSRVEGDNVGYLRITSFNEQTNENLKKGIDDIKSKIPADKLKGYVLDLRNNPGGLLDQAIAVSDTFLERGEIVSTRGRNPDSIERHNARPGDLTEGKPVIVLVNGGSASASEIVAGALQDHKRATIIGTRSFGKGSVQTIIPLGSQGALRLTTARYFTPSGRSIQAKGIDPDIEKIQSVPEDLKGKVDSKGEAGLKGHLSSGQSTEERAASSVYVPREAKDDEQLGYALQLLRGTETNAAFPPNPSRADLSGGPKKN